MISTVQKLIESKKNRTILSVTPQTSVFDAISIMAEHNIGSMLVMEGEDLKGIFSERDYVRKGIVKGRKANSTTMEEVMTSNLFTVEPKTKIVECMEVMSSKNIRHLPVLENGKVVGVLSVGDIVTAMIEEQKSQINYLTQFITG